MSDPWTTSPRRQQGPSITSPIDGAGAAVDPWLARGARMQAKRYAIKNGGAAVAVDLLEKIGQPVSSRLREAAEREQAS